jgi:serine/threonine-protein kinase
MGMTPERRREVAAVLEQALARDLADRGRFLDEACRSDPALRQEVESLLRADLNAKSFLDPPTAAATLPGAVLHSSDGSDLIERLQAALGGGYVIERELGGGGMSRVFVATETALGRRVVVKLLPPELAAALDVERFQREIRLAASLQHPHVVPVHSTGQADGILYYTMPFIEGESLKQRLEREGALPVPEVVRLLREVTDALSYAHRRGIIHRDLKPANILLGEGHALVTDFGIAKALVASTTATVDVSAGASLTSTGLVLGTPAYMAPEQAAGDVIDHRADLYAVGCLAYELLTGKPPFAGPSAQALIAAHIADEPEPVSQSRPGLPSQLNGLVLRLLAKRPADRPQSAQELMQELDRLSLRPGRHPFVTVLGIYAACALAVLGLAYLAMVQLGLPDWVVPGAGVLLLIGLPVIVATARVQTGRRAIVRGGRRAPDARSKHWLTWRRVIWGGLLAFSCLGAAAWFTQRHVTATGLGVTGPATLRPATSIAVLPFNGLGLDSSDEYLSDGLTEDLINTLSRVPNLRVVARTSAFTFKGKAEDVREVGRRLNVGAVVEGSLRKSGDTLQVTAQLINVADGYQLWADRYERVSAELLGIEDELSRAVVRAIGQRVGGAARGIPAVGRPTDNPEAYRLYLKGRYHLGKQTEADFRAALRYFDQAIGLDPTFALAYVGLSGAYGALYGTFLPAAEGMPKAKAAALKALELDPDLPDAHGILAGVQTMYEWDWQGAERSLRRALELRPNDPGFRSGYGWLLVVLGRLREATPHLDRAHQLDPLSMHGEVTSVWPLYYGHRYDEAIAALRKTVATDSSFVGAQFRLGEAYMHKGEFGPAEARLQAARALIGDHPDVLGRLGYLYAKSGRRQKAQVIADTLRARYQKGRSDEPYDLAIVYIGLGDKEKALDWLDTAYAERSSWMVFAKVSPELDALRSEPRFQGLLRQLHLD